jgi:DNA polymerase-4
LRGKPIAVAAYITPNGCILAPSIEAKRYGVKTGMRVKDGKLLCPNLIILAPDPWKYRNVHLALRRLISDYTADFNPKSIDEFVLNLEDYPSFNQGLWKVARDIKKRIRQEIGDWLTVSIGIAPNRFLAKLASELEKPDGLVEINKENFSGVYSKLKLTDLPYIKIRNAARLSVMGIFSVTNFYNAPVWRLKAAFESINGYYWYLRLRGWEIDDVIFGRKSYGNSYALPKPLVTCEELSPILSKLVMKMSSRLRSAGYKAKGVHLAIAYRDKDFWHRGIGLENEIFDTRDIYRCAFRILSLAPLRKPVRELAVSCFNLRNSASTQLDLFENIEKKIKITSAIDGVNERWGDYVITPARMLGAKESVPDRISFGGVKELEEFTLSGSFRKTC